MVFFLNCIGFLERIGCFHSRGGMGGDLEKTLLATLEFSTTVLCVLKCCTIILQVLQWLYELFV